MKQRWVFTVDQYRWGMFIQIFEDRQRVPRVDISVCEDNVRHVWQRAAVHQICSSHTRVEQTRAVTAK